jgi:hypothetical protein
MQAEHLEEIPKSFEETTLEEMARTLPLMAE